MSDNSTHFRIFRMCALGASDDARGSRSRLVTASTAALAASFLSLLLVGPTRADLTMVVQIEQGERAGSLIAVSDYLSEALGETVRIERRQNPLEHWRLLSSGERPAIVLEDPHFADYRVTRSGYRIVAAVEGRQLFAIAAAGVLLLEPMDLAGRPVAALAPPSLSTLQLLAFFPDAVHTPRIIESPSYQVAATRASGDLAVAAVLPVDALRSYPGLKGMLTMEELPAKAVSVAPELAETMIERIASALLAANFSAGGRRALVQLRVSGFIRGHPEAYEGYARLLKGTWGFRPIRP